ncbi:peroxidase-related enzyme [Streptomyces sp. NPDC097640]|uniref:peroxidase-related enzyme n=1 Tax=Streptomyces sp. NPDC097640 TaxID=3157229 RepID=UPI00332C8441
MSITVTRGHDVLDRFAGAAPEVTRLRALRPELVGLEQRAYDELFHPQSPGTGTGTGVSVAERAAAALAVAVEHRRAPAVSHYRALLTRDPGVAERIVARAPLEGHAPPRTAAAVAHARQLTRAPAEARLDALRAAGFTDPQIVTVSQAAAFAHHQMQLAAGLQLLATGESGTGTDPGAPSTTVDGGPRFTTDVLTWRPAIRPLAREELTEAHRTALAGKRPDTPYFRTLGHDLGILAVRTAIDLAAFTAEGGLPRAERELAATAVSLHSGCVYCVSVHARRAAQLHGDPEPVDRLLKYGSTAVLGRRWKLIVRLAAGLAPVPATAADADVQALRELGISELALVDLVHCASFFGWANRLMLSLGTVDGEAG